MGYIGNTVMSGNKEAMHTVYLSGGTIFLKGVTLSIVHSKKEI